ncbi:copia protein, partial [Tanacetum coccineum]
MMNTLAEHIIVAGAENRPPMLEKSMYDLWASHICLFIKGKKHGIIMLDLIDNGPLVYQTVEENGQIQTKKYLDLTEAQQLQDDCDVQATNIILHDLPPDVYALVNHQEAAKDIWDKVKLPMKGIKLSYQERECRFKFFTDVKLAKSLYTTNYDQFYASLSQHKRHAQEVRITRERYSDPLALVANSQTLFNPSQFPQHSGEDPIKCINKAMAFLSVVASRQSQSYVGARNRGIATSSKGNYADGQLRVMKCYNCQWEGHMARQCTQPKRSRNDAWFKENLLLVEAQETAFQTEDLDAYDSDCDDLSSAKAVLMANLPSCDSDVLSEVPYFD